MRDQRKSLPAMWAQMFGFFVVALVIASGSCRFNRPQAQVVAPKNPCSEESLRVIWGDNWHIGYMLAGCWVYEGVAESVAQPRPRLMVRGR